MSDRAASQERPRPDVIAALNRLDEVAPTLWQQQPKGHPMAPMQIPIREWVATIRAGLASQERPPIDVERLKQALTNAGYCLWDNDAGYAISDSDLNEVAAEYLRLSGSVGE